MLKLSSCHNRLGKQLRHKRKIRRLTQSELAIQANVSIPTIRLLENSQGNLSSFWQVLQALEMDVVGKNLPAGDTIGKQIAGLRKRKGISQRKLVQLVGVSQPTIIELERHATGRLQTLDRVLSVLGAEAYLVPITQSHIHHEDPFRFLSQLPTEKFQLVITSPPYNLGKEYEKRKTFNEYLEPYGALIHELYRTLAPGGSLCWEVGNTTEDGETFPLDVHFYPLFKDAGFTLRNRIIWSFSHGFHASTKFSGRYETILWFTKSDAYTFNLDPVRVPAKYPGKTHTKGPKKGLPSGNPLGKNPSDVWEVHTRDWEKELWNIPNVKSHHPEKTIHPCQFPVELVERCMLALTNEGDWVLDPFAGVGTTAIAAKKNGRHSVSIDHGEAYCDAMRIRLDELREGTLKTRPLTQAIQIPSGAMATAPEEWERFPFSAYNNNQQPDLA